MTTTAHTESLGMTLRAPGEPRHSDPSIPGFGICTHPEHGTACWIVTGTISDGKVHGRCSKHADSELDAGLVSA